MPRPHQIRLHASGGPDWINKEGWDITAKAAGYPGEIPFEKLRPMLRELIRERFQLSLQRSKQDLPYFALVVDKKGVKLKPSTAAETDFHLVKGITLTWLKVSLHSFASWLQPWLQSDRVVLDETGLSGDYDIRLQWTGQPLTATPEATAQALGPTIFTAVREQLGLRIESRRGPIDTLIVGTAVRPADN